MYPKRCRHAQRGRTDTPYVSITSAVMDEYEEAVLFTFTLLESRLNRLEYVLGGVINGDEGKPKTATERIHRIQSSLQELSSQTALITDAQQLFVKHKDILKPRNKIEDIGLNPAQKATLIVDRAPAFASIASQFKALDDQAIPPTDGFVKLSKLHPLIAETEARHLQQALKISDLRKRSALLVQRVKQIQFVGAAHCWTEWHKRLHIAERTVARADYQLRQDTD